MSHTFSVTIPEGMDLKAGVEEVKAGVAAAGGTFSFDSISGVGMFTVKGVCGSIKVVGKVITVNIHKKPFIVSNGYVEKTIRDYFSAAA